ncbi:MAG TPA: hypothetical protein VN700_00365 [Vicinamibacterales bacterium]|nr:hypothetical protein [Vicinamibacterales bacterium]
MKMIRNVSFVVLCVAASLGTPAIARADSECLAVATQCEYGGNDPAQRAEDSCNSASCDAACSTPKPEGCGSTASYGDDCSDGAASGQWQGQTVYCSSGVCHCNGEELE